MSSDSGAAPAPDSQIDTSVALTYWNSCDPSVTGMLGGFPQVSRIDLQQSTTFLAKLRRASKHHPPSKPLSRIVDCGAGIGRITLGLLSKVSTVTDIVEPVEKFTKQISEGDEFKALREAGKIGTIYNLGLETWEPEHTPTISSGYNGAWGNAQIHKSMPSSHARKSIFRKEGGLC
jgi:protein N-terminal methyltransferase